MCTSTRKINIEKNRNLGKEDFNSEHLCDQTLVKHADILAANAWLSFVFVG